LLPRFLSLRSIAVAAFLTLAGLAATNCSSAIAACDKQCDCEMCPTSAYNTCLAVGQSDAQTALQTGCSEELDNLLACQETGVCKSAKYETDCAPQKDAWKKCSESTK
jgi:hypothetical protein